jgi:hypothetical protein
METTLLVESEIKDSTLALLKTSKTFKFVNKEKDKKRISRK